MPKKHVTIIMKSGTKIEMHCDTLEVNSYDGKLTKFNYTGSNDVYAMYLDLEQIVAVIQNLNEQC